jgi:SAM-dependent methyltransferase
MTRPPRPDPDSLRYARHWEPVLAGPGRRLLERIEDEPVTFLDVGAGTGALAVAAAGRWPSARIIGLDASAGMLSVARHRVTVEGSSDDVARIEWLAADAAAMPLPPASVDVAVAAFVLQLVPDRVDVLSEAHRVLRHGGTIGVVTWIGEDVQMTADVEFDEAVYELELDEPEGAFREPRPGDFADLAEAEAELRRAGFVDIDVRPDELRHTWSREDFLAFKQDFDEAELYGSLGPADRSRLDERVMARWAALPDEAFSLRASLVSALARRPR